MLVLSRKTDEAVILTTAAGEVITVVPVEIRGNRGGGRKVRLGFNAPPSVTIHREEVQVQVDLAETIWGPMDIGGEG